MKPSTAGKLLLALVGIIICAAGGGIAGLVIIAAFNPGVKGPHITDQQALTSVAVGAILGAGLATVLVVWIRKRRR